jgi:DNA-binding beta-propeller fold protein YncE
MRRALLLVLLLAVAPVSGAMAQTWLFEGAHTIASTDTGWDYLTLSPDGAHLFAARRADGLLVWDTKAAKGVTVENSTGANGVVLVPPTGRGYVAMTDGTVMTFDIKSLKPLSRIDLGVGDLNGGFWEPTRNRVHMITATGAEKTTWVSLDAATGEVVGKTEFNSRKMDTPATDGRGAIYAPMRDKALLQQLDAKDLSLTKTWKLGDCQQPVAVEWDEAAGRVLVACRGDKPVFVALNPATGVVATIPIGRGVDGLVMDTKRHLIVTANGQDGTMTVIRQDTPDTYALVETIATRPMARVLQLDEATERLFTVTASFTQPAPGADGKPLPPIYHPDSFTILTFRPH